MQHSATVLYLLVAPSIPAQSRYSVAYPRLPVETAPGLAGAAVATIIMMFMVPSGAKPIVLVMGICVVGIIVTAWLAESVLSKDNGTPAMRVVSDPIKVRHSAGVTRNKSSGQFAFCDPSVCFWIVPCASSSSVFRWGSFCKKRRRHVRHVEAVR